MVRPAGACESVVIEQPLWLGHQQLGFGQPVQRVGHSREMRGQSDHGTAIRLLGRAREATQSHVVAHPVGERLHRHLRQRGKQDLLPRRYGRSPPRKRTVPRGEPSSTTTTA